MAYSPGNGDNRNFGGVMEFIIIAFVLGFLLGEGAIVLFRKAKK